jgi:hypothetical protein
MSRERESSISSTKTSLKKNLYPFQTQNLANKSPNHIINGTSTTNPNKRSRQMSSDTQSPPSNNLKTTKANDNMKVQQSTTFPPYTLILKNLHHNEHGTDRKLIEQFILEWKNKNGFELDITGRFGHEKCLLIFANNNTTFEELFIQDKWPNKINDLEYNLKVPRILPAAYSIVIHQFFINWNTNEVQEELKTIYPSLINLTRMISINNKPLNLVRADFCSAIQVKHVLNEGRITIGHMKNMVKPYHPPVRIRKCMKCYSHQHNTNECTSPVQLCIRCGLDHPFNNNCQNQIKCANCGQDHYAGHSACPEVQEIRRQISQNQKIKRTQLLISQEKEQNIQQIYNEHTFPPLPSTPTQQHQYQERLQPQPRTYTSVVQSYPQLVNKNNYITDTMENILMSLTNKIEQRLQQLEERLINQVVEIDKKLDNLKHNTSELETVIYEKLLPAIKTLQTYSINTTRKAAVREELTKHFNDITTLLANREIANTVTYKNHTNNTATTRLSISTTSTPINDSE